MAGTSFGSETEACFFSADWQNPQITPIKDSNIVNEQARRILYNQVANACIRAGRGNRFEEKEMGRTAACDCHGSGRLQPSK